MLARVGNRFENEFGLKLDYSLHLLPKVANFPEQIAHNGNEVQNIDFKNEADYYSNINVCSKVLYNYVNYFSEDRRRGYNLILTNIDGSDAKGYSSGAAILNGYSCVANLRRSGGDFQRYLGILHELSHLFGAEDETAFFIPLSIMSSHPKRKDFWGPLTKRTMKKNIDRIFGYTSRFRP